MSTHKATFTVTVTEQPDGWEVEISDREGDEYAKTFSRTLTSSLEMAVPYMRSAAQPIPFSGLLGELSSKGAAA